jgi:histidinol dehydrogenase
MRVIRHSEPDFEQRLLEMTNASALFDAEIEERARQILHVVRAKGDEALLELTKRFDGADLTDDRLAVSQAELLAASLQAGPEIRSAVAEASKNIAKFAQRSRRRNWESINSHGARVGEKFDPYQRVGIYIPGGKAPLVSTALMTIVLAKVAGCPEIVVCTPCDKEGSVNPALLYAAKAAGATEIYRVGGAQAIGALAYGTKTIRPVQKIFGPGNAYVVAAKRLVVGHVAIDLLPGPSEVFILADDTAPAAYIAADLLAQAEHGSGHERVWFATTSAKLIKAVARELDRQLPRLVRRELVERVLGNNAWMIQVKTPEAAISLANRLAPEHCEILAKQPRRLAERILTAGAIFLGPYSPTVLGDYVAGPSHTLPTGGAGASFGGLTIDQFQRRTSVVEYSRPALKRALKAVKVFADLEGLQGHGASAACRL